MSKELSKHPQESGRDCNEAGAKKVAGTARELLLEDAIAPSVSHSMQLSPGFAAAESTGNRQPIAQTIGSEKSNLPISQEPNGENSSIAKGQDANHELNGTKGTELGIPLLVSTADLNCTVAANNTRLLNGDSNGDGYLHSHLISYVPDLPTEITSISTGASMQVFGGDLKPTVLILPRSGSDPVSNPLDRIPAVAAGRSQTRVSEPSRGNDNIVTLPPGTSSNFHSPIDMGNGLDTLGAVGGISEGAGMTKGVPGHQQPGIYDPKPGDGQPTVISQPRRSGFSISPLEAQPGYFTWTSIGIHENSQWLGTLSSQLSSGETIVASASIEPNKPLERPIEKTVENQLKQESNRDESLASKGTKQEAETTKQEPVQKQGIYPQGLSQQGARQEQEARQQESRQQEVRRQEVTEQELSQPEASKHFADKHEDPTTSSSSDRTANSAQQQAHESATNDKVSDPISIQTLSKSNHSEIQPLSAVSRNNILTIRTSDIAVRPVEVYSSAIAARLAPAIVPLHSSPNKVAQSELAGLLRVSAQAAARPQSKATGSISVEPRQMTLQNQSLEPVSLSAVRQQVSGQTKNNFAVFDILPVSGVNKAGVANRSECGALDQLMKQAEKVSVDTAQVITASRRNASEHTFSSPMQRSYLTCLGKDTPDAVRSSRSSELARNVETEEEKKNLPEPTNHGWVLAVLLSLAAAARGKSENTLRSGTTDIGNEKDESASAIPKVLKRRIHLVEAQDSLQTIAERYFGDIRVGWLIADLNAVSSQEHEIEGKRVVELRQRQALQLPETSEVTQFLFALPRNFDIDSRLATVVSDTAVNAEVLRLFFANLMLECKLGGDNNTSSKLLGLPELTILGSDA